MNTINMKSVLSLDPESIKRDAPFSPTCFGIKVPEDKQANPYFGFSQDNPFQAYVPALDPDYEFEASVRMATLLWLNIPQDLSLWISGPTGCGKTSIVEQTASRFNWPVMKLTASPDLEFNSLIGGLRLVCDELTGDQKTEFFYGPLALAYKYGLIFLIDEYDQLEASCANAFNAILEGGNIIIPETDEVIKKHPNFRFVVTANSIGQGDISGVYGGVKTMNVANLDRYMFINTQYLPKETETKIIAKITGDETIAGKFVDVANHIRSLFVGADITGLSSDNPADKTALPPAVANERLSITCSTRSLKAWVKRLAFMQKVGMTGAFKTSFDWHIGNRASAAEKEALLIIIEAVFGSDIIKR